MMDALIFAVAFMGLMLTLAVFANMGPRTCKRGRSKMGAPNKIENAFIVLGMVFALAVIPTIYTFRWPIVFGSGLLFILLGS